MRKIITTSTSCLSFMEDSKDIEIIPDIIKFSDNEVYNDCIDYSPQMLFNRMLYDRYANLKIYAQKVFYIKELIKRLMNDGYDSFIFILPSIDILDYKTNVNIATAKLDCQISIYEARYVGYPLAYLALEANKMLENDISTDEILKKIKYLDSRMGVYLFNFKNDLVLDLATNIDKMDLSELDKGTRVYKLESGRLTQLKHDKSKSGILYLLELFLNDIKDNKTLPFIMTSTLSQYRVVIEKKITLLYEGLNKTPVYNLPSLFARLLGGNCIAIGYIKKD